MNIVVSAAALRTSGALTIYNQFLQHLQDNISNDHYFVFVSASQPRPIISGVKYITVDLTSWINRIFFDYYLCRRYMHKLRVEADCVISLQNTCVHISSRCKSLLYYHQSLPFYPQRWNPLKSNERKLFFYKNVYPYFVKTSLYKNTQVVVQIPFIKRAFIKCYRHQEDNVHVLFPDIEKTEVEAITPFPFDMQSMHLIYPATSNSYKNHIVLCRALGEVKRRNPIVSDKIRLHFTLSKNDCPDYIMQEICSQKINSNICFEGVIPHDTLLQMYKSADALLFPSTIETLGLPLLEAASFGLPIGASDLDYAHEVMADYNGIRYISPYDEQGWANYILLLCEQSHKRFTRLQCNEHSSWNEFFRLIK